MADSLSDLEGKGFNKLLSDSNVDSKSTNKQSKLEKEQLGRQIKFSTGDIKKALQDRYDNTVSDKEETNNNNINLSSNHSLFDKFALIDYGRYIRSDAWEEWRSNSGVFDPSNKDSVFDVNNKIQINQPIANQENISTEGLTISSLVKWSEKYPSLQLRFQDFVYCKKMGFFPNNRLIVLRRFKKGVPDNLFDHINKGDMNSVQPISTMVTWLKPEETPFSLSFSEQWQSNDRGIFDLIKDTVKKDLGIDADKYMDITAALTPLALQGLSSNSSSNLRRSDGMEHLQMNVGGDPNLINSSSQRKLPKDNQKGLSSGITFDISFEYQMCYINGVDPGVAMLDLISNCLRMGTSVGHFRFPVKGLSENELLQKVIDSNFQLETESFVRSITDKMKEMSKYVEDLMTNGKKASTSSNSSAPQGIGNLIVKNIIGRYREELKSALSADTGLPSGIWHVTIGNPMQPIISCGDLIIESANIELGKELGFNDFPNSFICKIRLTSARERGRDELERIFNAGRGRIYVYPRPDLNPDNHLYNDGKNTI